MKQRTITAIVYVVVLLGLLALKWLFPDYGGIGFDVLFWIISFMGAYEFIRAVGCISPAQKWATLATCMVIVPVFVISKMLTDAETALMTMMAVACLGVVVTASLLVFDFKNSTLKSTAFAELCIMYCGAMGSMGSHINHLYINSFAAILFLFLLTTATDTFAFLIGSAFGRFLPIKLAPHTSPNKTVIGAIGGVIGGIIAACVTYAICTYLPISPYSPEGYVIFEYHGSLHPCLLLVLIAIPTSIFAQLGDLFESAIKRGCGIKDMGNILPGHGGMLDRFDSMLFAALSIIVCFMIIR
jgi:phosphatidate cytidylyltransferase